MEKVVGTRDLQTSSKIEMEEVYNQNSAHSLLWMQQLKNMLKVFE